MTKKVFNLIILDESGSMCSIVRATLWVSGFSRLVKLAHQE